MIGNRFLFMHKSPAFWDRPEEYYRILGKTEKPKYENYRMARGYPHMEFDTSYYTRVNFVPPLLPNGKREERLILNPKNNVVDYPSHVPMAWWTLREDIIEENAKLIKDYGIITQDVLWTGDYESMCFDRDADFEDIHH